MQHVLPTKQTEKGGTESKLNPAFAQHNLNIYCSPSVRQTCKRGTVNKSAGLQGWEVSKSVMGKSVCQDQHNEACVLLLSCLCVISHTLGAAFGSQPTGEPNSNKSQSNISWYHIT